MMTIDLNSQHALSGQITYLIDEGLAEAKESPRRYLGGSVLGDPCERAVQYEALAAMGQVEKPIPSARLQRIFARGHAVEDLAAGWLRGAGFALVTDQDGRQLGFETLGGRVRGHLDGILAARAGHQPFEFPALWECKCLGAKYWRDLKKKKLKKSRPKYYGQAQVYMGEFGLSRCLFTAVNADDMDLYFELVEYDAAEHTRLMERAARVLQYCDAGELVPRSQSKPEHFECRMCSWSAICWS